MTNNEIANIVSESLRDWFKKEKWVRITTSGNIAGPCGTSKNKKNPDRCLPKAKAQSLSKAERAATARKKKKAGAKGKTVVANTKKAKVKKETKEAPAGHYFTKSGNLVKGRMSKDAKERGARKSDPKDKMRSKVPPVSQYTEGQNEWPKEVHSRHKEYIFKLTKIGSDRAKYSVIDIETGEQKGSIVFNTIDQLQDFANNYIKPQGGRQSSHFGTSETANPQDGKAAPYGSGYKKLTKEDIRNLVAGTIYEMQNENTIMEKDDRCTRIAKRKYDTWPSAYASGAVVRCRRGEIWKKEK